MYNLIGQTDPDDRFLVGLMSLSTLGLALVLDRSVRECAMLTMMNSGLSCSIQVRTTLIWLVPFHGEAAREMGCRKSWLRSRVGDRVCLQANFDRGRRLYPLIMDSEIAYPLNIGIFLALQPVPVSLGRTNYCMNGGRRARVEWKDVIRRSLLVNKLQDLLCTLLKAFAGSG